MVDKRLIEEWLQKADEDYGFASSVLDNSAPVHWPSGYTKETAFKARDAAKNISETIKSELSSLI